MQIQSNELVRKLTVIAGISVGLIFLAHELELHLPQIEHWTANLGTWAPLGFIGFFLLLTPLFISVDALCFTAGLLFSLVAGEIYMIVATYLSAALIFVLGRYYFRGPVSELLAKHPTFSGVNAALEQQAFKLMLLLRLTPLPFALLSYSFALAPVRFWPYLWATSGIFLYNGTLVYLGYTTKHLAGIIGGDIALETIPHGLLVVGLLLTLAVLAYVSKLAGKTINQIRDHK